MPRMLASRVVSDCSRPRVHVGCGAAPERTVLLTVLLTRRGRTASAAAGRACRSRTTALTQRHGGGRGVRGCARRQRRPLRCVGQAAWHATHVLSGLSACAFGAVAGLPAVSAAHGGTHMAAPAAKRGLQA
eukprot:363682-Chlamydomonas_euryale.AAC.8